MIWLFVSHLYVYAFSAVDNAANVLEQANNLMFQPLFSAQLAVDTFFVLRWFQHWKHCIIDHSSLFQWITPIIHLLWSAPKATSEKTTSKILQNDPKSLPETHSNPDNSNHDYNDCIDDLKWCLTIPSGGKLWGNL